MIRKCFMLASVMTMTLSGFTQNIGGPSLNLGFSSYPSVGVEDGEGTFKSNNQQIGLSLPVYTDMKLEGGPKITLFGIQSSFSRAYYEVSEWNDDHTLFLSDISGYGLFSTGKNTFYTNIGLTWLGDESFGSSISPLASGMFFYRRKAKEKFSYFVGGAYSFAFGGGFPFPVLGFQTGTQHSHTFQMVLPLVLSFKSPASKPFGYGFHLRPDGNIAFYQDNGQFGDELILRTRAIKLGGDVSYRIGSFKMTLEANLLTNRSILLSDKDNQGLFDDSLWSRDLENGGQIELTLSYRFSRAGNGADVADLFGSN